MIPVLAPHKTISPNPFEPAPLVQPPEPTSRPPSTPSLQANPTLNIAALTSQPSTFPPYFTSFSRWGKKNRPFSRHKPRTPTPPTSTTYTSSLPSTTRHSAALNISNERENTDMGDSLQDILTLPDCGKNMTCISVGPNVEQDKWRQQIIRLYFQNVNGLRLADDCADITETFLHLQNVQADIFGIVETQLHCRKPDIQSKLQNCKRRIWDNCALHTASSEEEWNYNRKPGGTLLGITGPLAGRMKLAHKDQYGRWVHIDLLGRDGRLVSIICAYQVVQEKGSHGDRTTYSQQVRLMRLAGIQDPDPRKQFIRDLRTLVSSLRKNGNDIILMGDFNESIGDKADEMASVMLAGGLTDTHCFRHGLTTEKPTYARGSKRVDYVLVSRRLTEYIHRCGAEPFNLRIFSDHRGLFVDFSLPGFFDRAPNTLAKLHTRDLIYDCPRHVRQYLLKTATYFREHDILFRLNELLEGERDDEEAEAIDRDITRAMLAAEAKCKSTNRQPWSRDLHQAMNRLYILKRVLSQWTTGLNMDQAINIMQQKLSTPITIPSSLSEIKNALREARRDCRNVIAKGYQQRKDRTKDRITALQMANPDKDKDIVAKEYTNTQASKEMYRRVPTARPPSSGGISMIKVPISPEDDPKAAGTLFKSVVEPVEVEHHILLRNKKHFSQARETPFAVPAVLDALSFSGTSSIADQLIKGTMDTTILTPDRFAQSILNQCHRSRPEMHYDITLEEFKASYKKWRVGTSTSPSGRHLSHQHALFQPHGINQEEDPEQHSEAEQSRLDNWTAQHGIVSYGTQHGYCFNRWKQVVNAMIEKEPGNPQLHRLRVIHLYESDYNSILGIKLRSVVHDCEDSQVLNPGCYGSRSNRQASDPTYIEVLQYDYASLTRWPEIKFNNDATSCYDRIIPSISNVIARSMGLHSNIANIHGHMLEQAEYRIKTQLGISSGFYIHSLEHPVFGTGQGSCASPTIWMLNCSKYFDIYDSHCYGSKYINMAGTEELKLGMTGFVDDSGNNVNCQPEEIHTLSAKATHDAQLWNDILWSSGGALEHSKCCYHYLQTIFHETGAPFFRPGKFDTSISITDKQGVRTEIPQLSAYTPYKTLGTYQAATSGQITQFQVLEKKSKDLTRILTLSSCSAHAAWLFYSSVFTKGVGYPLSVSRLSPKQLKDLQGPMLSITLNRMHYPKRLCHALVHGPRSLGGLEFSSLVTMQGSSKLTLLIRHLRTPGQPKSLSLKVIDRLQYTAGVGYHILEHTAPILPQLEGVWMPTVRDYLQDIHGSLKIANLSIQPLQRHGDQYLMDMILAQSIFSPLEVQRLNYCRLYLRALSLSDICNAQGTCLAIGVFQGLRSSQLSQSTLKDPLQERPSDHVWAIWRRFLKILCYDKLHLKIPLGPWYYQPSTRRRWPNYYSYHRDLLFRFQDSDKLYSSHRRQRHQIYRFQSDDDEDALPPDVVPVDITDTSDGWRISSFKKDPPILIPDAPVQTFHEFIHSLPPHESLLLAHHDILCGDAFDADALLFHLDNVILVSDGGALEKYGSYGWVLGLQDGTRIAQGSGSVYGYDPKSYRAEGYGAKAGTLFLLRLFQYCGRSLPSTEAFEFYCDNQGLLKKLEYFRSHTNAIQAACMHSEWDIVSTLHRLQLQFPILPSLTHVKGHQDTIYHNHNLALPAQMNVEADLLATLALQHWGSPKSVVPFDPLSYVMLSIKGRAVTRNLESAIRLQQHINPIRKYYRKRFQWDSTTLDDIDWDLFSTAYSKFPRTRTFFSKLGWKLLPIGTRLHKRTPSYDHRCPSCHQDFETDDHIFQCSHSLRAQWRDKLLHKISDTFGSYLDSSLLALIHLGLNSFFTNTLPIYSERFPRGYSSTPYNELIQQQTAIGWDHFIRGKLSPEWASLQYYISKREGTLKESEGWTLKLIKLMANSSFQLWEIRNGCRHGIDEVTQQQSKRDQAHRELCCLYALREQVLPQDSHLFRASLDLHLTESVSQIRSWLTHNKKLIVHSNKIAKKQSTLKTHRLQTFFQSRTHQSKSVLPLRPSQAKNGSKHNSKRFRPAFISRHFRTAYTSRSSLPVIPDGAPLPAHLTNQPPRQQFIDSCFIEKPASISRLPVRPTSVPQTYPDHPG